MNGFSTPILIAIAVAALFVVLLILGYLKAPPDTAYIISGLGKKRILIGRAGWRVPFFERVDKLSLKVMQVDVKTSEAVPTNEFINVSVDGVANIKISSNPDLLKRAAEALRKGDEDVAYQLFRTQRGFVGIACRKSRAEIFLGGKLSF